MNIPAYFYSTKFNLAISLIEKISQLIVTLICLKLMASSLSIADNGKYAYALSLMMIFGSISCYAGSELILPKLSRYKYLSPYIITHGWYLRMFYASLCLIMAIFIAYFYILDSGIRKAFITLMLIPFFMEVSGIFSCWFMVNNQYIFPTVARLIGFIVRLVIVYLLAAYQFSFEYFAYANLIELICMSIIIYAFYFTHRNHYTWTKFHPKIFKILLKQGIYIGVGLSFSFLFLKLDRYLLKQYISFEELGLYAVAMQLNDAFILVSQAMLLVLINRYIFSRQNNKLQVIKYISYAILLSSIAAIVISFFLGEFIITTLINIKYIQSANILHWAIVLAPFNLINYLLYNYFLHLKRYLFISKVWLCGLFILLILSNILIPLYNIYGILLAYFSAYIAMTTIYFYSLKHNRVFIYKK